MTPHFPMLSYHLEMRTVVRWSQPLFFTFMSLARRTQTTLAWQTVFLHIHNAIWPWSVTCEHRKAMVLCIMIKANNILSLILPGWLQCPQEEWVWVILRQKDVTVTGLNVIHEELYVHACGLLIYVAKNTVHVTFTLVLWARLPCYVDKGVDQQPARLHIHVTHYDQVPIHFMEPPCHNTFLQQCPKDE